MAKRQPNPYFRFQKFTIYHDQCAMKVGTDGVLLGAWADVTNAASALDIGTGTGLISLMLAQRSNTLKIDAIDIDNQAIRQSKLNIKESPFSENITVREIALQNFVTNKKYDLIVSNPPFFNDSLKSDNEQRNLARHTDSLSVEELLTSSINLLSERGKIALIYPYEYKERLIELTTKYNLSISKLTSVLPTPTSKPKRIILELSNGKSTLEEKTLILEEERHVYSADFKELIKDFYLKL